jgi:predicted transcriptional regulator
METIMSKGVKHWMIDGKLKLIRDIPDLVLVSAIQSVEAAMLIESEKREPKYDSIVNMCSENHPKYNDLLLEAVRRGILRVKFVMRQDGTRRFIREWTEKKMEFTLPESEHRLPKRKINIE